MRDKTDKQTAVVNLPAACFFILLVSLVYCGPLIAEPGPVDTIIVTAEGLADPNADIYKKDKGMMVDDLRLDARRQAVEKAVGIYVESSSLMENYLLIEDRVLSKSQGLIKQIISQSSPKLGKDGLMHMHIKAEVFLSDVKQALDSLSKQGRISLIKEHGNPSISVAIVVRDAQRGSETPMENSPIAENILKDQFVNFGYRVWSEEYTKLIRREAGAKKSSRRVADFSVLGQAKFKRASVTLKASGITLTKHILTSWTVKCINNHTGEEIYFNNKVPRKKGWADEDQALEDIGRLIGQEFTKDFFEGHLMQPSQIFEVQLTGLEDYDTALLFQDEFSGLRPILNVELLDFNADSFSRYEVECISSGKNFMRIVHSGVIKPVNLKLNGPKLKLVSHHGNVVKIAVIQGEKPVPVQEAISANPPASLASASPERVEKLIQNKDILKKVAKMNPNIN